MLFRTCTDFGEGKSDKIGDDTLLLECGEEFLSTDWVVSVEGVTFKVSHLSRCSNGTSINVVQSTWFLRLNLPVLSSASSSSSSWSSSGTSSGCQVYSRNYYNFKHVRVTVVSEIIRVSALQIVPGHSNTFLQTLCFWPEVIQECFLDSFAVIEAMQVANYSFWHVALPMTQDKIRLIHMIRTTPLYH